MRGESADACYECGIVRRAICLGGKVGIAPEGGVVLTCEQHLPRNIPARFHPLAATSVVPASQLPSSAFDVVTLAINIALLACSVRFPLGQIKAVTGISMRLAV